MVALRNLRSIHRSGCETTFDRLTCHVSSLWLVQLATFMTTTGEAGFFMQTFGLLSGLVLATHWHRTHTLHLDAPAPKTLFRIAARDDEEASPAGSGQPAA